MAQAPSPSILVARAVELRRRADALAASASDPHRRDSFALIALAARDAQAWLEETEPAPDPDRLTSVDATLQALAARLDELEDLVRARPPAAKAAR